MRSILLVFVLFSTTAFAQKKYTISGYVRDSTNGETLIGATFSATNGTSKGIATNSFGYYSITLVEGKYEIAISMQGYKTATTFMEVNHDAVLNFSIHPLIKTEQEVVVKSRRSENIVKSTQMGKFTLPVEQIKSIPAFMGEVDILKAIQLLPGIRNAGEGSSGFYVRGGGPDQNLILLDDAPVYNPGHLFGFFSVFNSDAIKNVSVIKGGMPAQYGGRLSSVLDISMKEGNNKDFKVEGGLGLIASRLSIQGPLKKEKASFIVSARRTYIDALTKPFIKSSSAFYGSGYYFYDLNAKVNYKFSDKDRIYLSGYFGRDVFDFVNGKQSLNVNIPWGNSTGTFRWNHVFNTRLFSNTTVAYNDYNFLFNASQNKFEVRMKSGIRDMSIKQDFDLYPFTGHKIKFGGLYIYHHFTPSVISGKQDSLTLEPQNAQIKYAHEAALYFQDDWDISDRVKVNMGLRQSFFQQVGPFTQYVKDANGNKMDSTVYGSGKKVKTYNGLEPRVTLRFNLNDESSLKFAASKNYQFVHLVSNSGTTLPTDIWVPSTYLVKPQISWLYAAGYFRNFKNNMYEASVELYYKDMQNQIEYKEGYTPNTLDDTENSFVFGKGWSYGSEFLINKLKGRLTGWIGYTLSYTNRKFTALNEGKTFPAKYDRRHDMSVVGMYKLNDKWKLSATFVYGSGNAATLPQRFYIIDGIVTQEYSRINEYRLPAYHRLDLAAILTPKKAATRRVKGEWVFSVYNAYSRFNPYFIYFAQEGSVYNGTLKVQAKKVALFPILPAVTWNFKF